MSSPGSPTTTTTFVGYWNSTSPPTSASWPKPIGYWASASTSSSPIPHAGIINAAFAHAHPLGSRFNGPDRGAWYAGAELATSQAEVAWHKWIELVEVDWLEESVTYDDYLADFAGEFHDIREDGAFEGCLAPDSYVESQSLGESLLQQGSSGIIYPSVRRKGGTCLACFRPALVDNVRKGARYRFTWSGSQTPVVRIEQGYP